MSDGTTATTKTAVRLLAAQAVAFGLMCALLVIPANAIFLGAYGSEWLPVTYLAVAVVGAGASTLIAQTVRRRPLALVATVALGTCALLYLASWIVLASGDASWPSAVLVPLFPIQLQLGFVFIGGQAGRLLDVHQIKAKFPRIIAGFPVGFTVGSLLGPVLLSVLGATKHIFVFTTLAELAFIALILLTARKVPAPAAAPEAATALDEPEPPRPPLRKLLSTRFVLLVLSYQVLSAMGSQVLDFLVFDRAAARYANVADLTRFVSWYSVALNVVDIIILAVIAGALLKRFGLRLGLAANPSLVTGLIVAMAVAFVASGAGSLAVFGFVTAARIFDIALTDGMTRTSIAATYQVIPPDERVAVQAGVEGVGVPVAIGLTGVLLIIVNLLDLGVGPVIGMALVLCAGWAVAAVLVFRDYGGALASRLRRRSSLADIELDDEQERVAARALIAGDDVADMRLGLELLAQADDARLGELRRLAAHRRVDIRLLARTELCHAGTDGDLMDRLVEDAATACRSTDVVERRAAAGALRVVRPTIAEPMLATLLRDDDVHVRRAALASVDDRFPRLLPAVLAALDDPSTASEARHAVGRLGDAAVADVAASLLALDGPPPTSALRRVRALRPTDATAAADSLGRLLHHRDRAVVLEAARVLATVPAVASRVAPDVDGLLRDAAALAAAVAAARRTIAPAFDQPLASLDRALFDEQRTARALVLAGLAVEHEPATVDDIDLGLRHDDGSRRALAVELLGVVAGRLRTDQLLPALTGEGHPSSGDGDDLVTVLRDLITDPHDRWRSRWLQACALRVLGTVDEELAAELARPLVDASDPVLAETAAWALQPAAAG